MSNLLFVIGCIVISFVLGYLFCYTVFKIAYTRLRYDGTLLVSEKDTSQIHQLEITTDPEQLKDQDKVIFRVRKIPTVED